MCGMWVAAHDNCDFLMNVSVFRKMRTAHTCARSSPSQANGFIDLAIDAALGRQLNCSKRSKASEGSANTPQSTMLGRAR